MRVGSLEWGRRGGGRLTMVEKWGQNLQHAQASLRQWSQARLRRLGLVSPRLAPAAWRGLQIPLTSVAQAATALCAGCSPEYLLNHSLRSYAWATLLAQRDDLRFDHEELYLACILHDIGLTQQAPPCGSVCCFAISGALEAERFLLQHGYPARSTAIVADAIALHLNGQVPLASGAAAHLLRQATALDLTGLGKSRIGKEAREHVVARYPRHDFKPALTATLLSPAISQPNTRAHLLCCLGLDKLIARASD